MLFSDNIGCLANCVQLRIRFRHLQPIFPPLSFDLLSFWDFVGAIFESHIRPTGSSINSQYSYVTVDGEPLMKSGMYTVYLASAYSSANNRAC